MNPPALRFGRYESLFRINAGGMAEVFAARALGEGGFEKIVAVKRILPHLLADDRFVRMFLDEARVAACIESPHVVQTLDVGRDEKGGPYLAMELVVGLTLLELIQLCGRARVDVPPDVAVEILVQAASGLDSAHDARTARGEPLGIVHRDISPQNVLVGADGRVRVSDFGIAQVALGKLAETQAGEVKGKFAYLSPEQSHGAPLDRRSDVFALGIVAWETLAGRRLFASPSPFDTIEAVRHGPIPRLVDLVPDVTAALDDVVLRALERRRDDRWPTARAFGNALRAACPPCGPEGVASLVSALHSQRVEQMRDRIRLATTLPSNETLPDIQVDEPVAIEQERPVVGEAVTRLIAARPPDMTFSDAVASAPTRLLAGEPVPADRRRRARALVGAGVVVVVATLGLAALAISDGAREARTRAEPTPSAVAAAPDAPASTALGVPAPSEATDAVVPSPAVPLVPPSPAAEAPRRTARRESATREPSPTGVAPEDTRAASPRARGPLDLGAFDEAVGRSR